MTKILVIEDEQAIRDSLLDLLEAEGFDTCYADNGLEGLHLALNEDPDLVLCDVNLPELDGYGVLTQLRAQPDKAALPFIFLTARSTKADFRYGMELGADDYLQKPCSGEELLGAIAARMSKRAALQAENLEAQIALGLGQPTCDRLSHSNHSLDGLLNYFYQELRNPLSNLNLVIHFLRNNGAPIQTETIISLQQDYSRELVILEEVLKLQSSLTPECLMLLRTCNLDRLGFANIR